MKISIGSLRRIIRESLEEQTWVPGRYYPGSEPLDSNDRDRLNSQLGEDDDLSLDEVDLDPSNNPGRPADAYEYVGMRPPASAAMAHPSLSGGGAVPGAEPDSSGDSTESLDVEE